MFDQEKDPSLQLRLNRLQVKILKVTVKNQSKKSKSITGVNTKSDSDQKDKDTFLDLLFNLFPITSQNQK